MIFNFISKHLCSGAMLSNRRIQEDLVQLDQADCINMAPLETSVVEEEQSVESQETKPLLQRSNVDQDQGTLRIRILGCSLAFISGLIFTANNCVIQTQHLDYSEIVFVRSLVQLSFLGMICYVRGLSLWPSSGERPLKMRLIMIVQGFCGALMIMFSFCCVLFLPLGDALTLLFSAPLSTMIVAAIFLRHQLRFFKIFFGLLLLVGTTLVIQPEFLFMAGNQSEESGSGSSSHPPKWFLLFAPSFLAPESEGQTQAPDDQRPSYYYIGVGLALGSAVVDGFLNVAINYCQRINSLVLLWWTGIGGLIVSLFSFTFDPNAKMLGPHITEILWNEWMAYFVIAFSGIAAYFCMTKSLQMIDPTVVAFIRSLEIVLAYIVQYAVIGDNPNTLSLIGAGIVLICVTAMTLQNVLVSFVPERFRFLC